MAVSVYHTVFDDKHSHRGIRLEPAEMSCTAVRQVRLSCHAGEATMHSLVWMKNAADVSFPSFVEYLLWSLDVM